MENKPVRQNKYGLIIQLLCMLATIVFLIMWAWDNMYFNIALITTGLTLLSMAYNNHTVYNRKNVTLLYIITGILVIINGVMGLING